MCANHCNAVMFLLCSAAVIHTLYGLIMLACQEQTGHTCCQASAAHRWLRDKAVCAALPGLLSEHHISWPWHPKA